jgi:hypothetical protein
MAIKEPAPLLQFASWSVPQFPAAIEYPPEIMEEIRAFACDELLQLSHGGNEAGGVLFGTRREDLVRILTWRPIACEHAHGESLLLSYNDRMNLAVQLELARQNADLKDLRPLGCFISHARGTVSLSPSDLEIYNGFFPESWQVALVICPQGGGRAEAGFFVREREGKLEAGSSYRPFEIKPLDPASAPAKAPAPVKVSLPPPPAAPAPAAPAHPPANARTGPAVSPSDLPPDVQELLASYAAQAGRRASRPAAKPRHAEPRAEPSKVPPPAPPDEVADLAPSFQTEERLSGRERWLWAVPIVLAAGIAAFLLYQRHTPSANAIGLRASNLDQTVQLNWDAGTRAVQDSYRGEIDISDGANRSQVALTKEQLRAGKLAYQPQSGDVAFDMTVYPSNGDPVHDSTRIITPAVPAAPTQPPQLLPVNPAPSTPVASANIQRPAETERPADAAPSGDDAALQRQVEQLKVDLGKERARADELQNLVRILEQRLGIQSDPRAEGRH